MAFKIQERITERGFLVDQYLSDLNNKKYDVVSPEEENEILLRIKNGDPRAVQELIQHNARFVVSVAKKYQGNGLELPDLIQEGNMGMLTAASKFEPERGFKFITYAVWWIEQTIRMSLTNFSKTIRLPLNHVNLESKIKKCSADFLVNNGMNPTVSDLFDMLNIDGVKHTEHEIKACIENSLRKPTSLSKPVGDGEDSSSVEDMLSSDDKFYQADNIVDKESIQIEIALALKNLPKRQQIIIQKAIIEEQHIDDIADHLNLTRERVRQLKKAALNKLKRNNKLKSYL